MKPSFTASIAVLMPEAVQNKMIQRERERERERERIVVVVVVVIVVVVVAVVVVVEVTSCFTPSRPLRLYQGDEREREHG